MKQSYMVMGLVLLVGMLVGFTSRTGQQQTKWAYHLSTFADGESFDRFATSMEGAGGWELVNCVMNPGAAPHERIVCFFKRPVS
jgi:hypothetical protein